MAVGLLALVSGKTKAVRSVIKEDVAGQNVFFILLWFAGDEPWEAEHGRCGRSIMTAVVGLDGSPPPAHGGEAYIAGEREALQAFLSKLICEVQPWRMGGVRVEVSIV